MVVNAHFEKVSFSEYVKARMDNMVFSSCLPYLVENGIFPSDTMPANPIGVEDEKKLRENIIPGSIDEARLHQLFKKEYNCIKLPERKTEFCLGYDFFIPCDIDTKASCVFPINIPTGIRCIFDLHEMNPDNFSGLFLFPRSSTGIKKGFSLSNCIGVIEPDYHLAENQGHIIASLTPNIDSELATIFNNTYSENDNKIFKAGDRFVQGVFLPVTVTPDEANRLEQRDPMVNDFGTRSGGIGSTGE